MNNFSQPIGANYQPSANILQQIAQMRKQQGAQPDASAGLPQTPQQAQQPQQPQQPQNKAGDLDTIHQLSQMFGYEPNTVFGYNLGSVVSKMPTDQQQPTGISGALGSIAQGNSVGNSLAQSSQFGKVLSGLFGG